MFSNRTSMLALAACMVSATTVHAQDSGEIVVTANKREQNLNDVGLSVTAVSGAALTERKITSLEDIGSLVPGLVYAPSTTNTPIFTLRGVGFNESSLGVYPAVSIYVDQFALPFPVLASHAAFDLERVEVLKGPQGTLFGQNSTGGAINYIAAKPTDQWETGGDISYSRFNQVDGNAYISGPLGPTAGVRFAMTGLNSDGWQQSYTRRDTNGAQSYIAGRLTLDWRPNDRIKLSLTGTAWNDDSEPQAQQLVAIHEVVNNTGGPGGASAPPVDNPLRNYISPPLVAGTPSAQLSYPFSPLNARAADWSTLALDPNTVASAPDGTIDPTKATYTNFRPFGHRKFWQGGLRADVDLGGVTLTSLSSYAHYTQEQATDGDGMALVGFDLQKGEGYIKTFSQELRLANASTSRLRWLAGANYENSKTFEDQLLRYFANSNYSAANFYINASGDRLKQDIRNYAFFGNLELDVSPKLTIRGGVRYTNSRIHALNAAYTLENGNVEKIFNLLGFLGGDPSFAPIGPGDSYTLNTVPTDASGNPIALPEGLTINSPLAAGPGTDLDGNPATPNNYSGLGVPGIPLDATLKQHNVSWRVGLDYKPTEQLLFYANVSRGYKAGSFPTLAVANYITALPVSQEYVTAYEAGFKAGLLDHRVQLNAAAFYMDYRNKQVRGKLFDFVFGTQDVLVNVPKSRIWGAEADLTVRPLKGLTLTGAITYLNSKVLNFVGYDIFGGVDNPNFDPTGAHPNTEDLSGNVLPYTPKWSGTLNLDYKFEMANGGQPFLGFTVNAKSGQDAAIGGSHTTLPVMPGNRYRIASGVGPYPYIIDGYATVDARLGYVSSDENWRVMIWGKNVFNKYYWTAVIPSSDSSARFAGRPATYGITFGFNFK